MNKILNMFLLAGDQFMPEMHLKLKLKLRPFTKTKSKDIIQNFKEAGDSKYIYQNELKKTYFQHEMADGDLRIYLEEHLMIKYYVIKHFKDSKYDGNRTGLASIVYKFFEGKPSGRAFTCVM